MADDRTAAMDQLLAAVRFHLRSAHPDPNLRAAYIAVQEARNDAAPSTDRS